MKKTSLLVAAVLLGGCASAPSPRAAVDLTEPVVTVAPTGADDPSDLDVTEPEPATVFVRLEHIVRTEKLDVDVTLPILASADRRLAPAMRDISARVRSMAERDIARIENLAIADGAAGAEPPHAIHMTCRPALVTDRLVSIACDTYTYTGGAHGLHGTTGHNYLLSRANAQPIELPAILAKEASLAVADLCIGDLREQGATFIVDGTTSTSDVASYLENFTITPEGVVFHFAPYSVGSYAEGDYEVLLDFSRLGPRLRDSDARTAIERGTSGHDRSVKLILGFEPNQAATARITAS